MSLKVIVSNYKRLISVKELYKELYLTKDFTEWFYTIVNMFNYEIEVDYVGINDDYAITIQFAREICVIENNYRSKSIYSKLKELQGKHISDLNYIKLKRKVNWDKFNVSEIAKELGITAKKLNSLLEHCNIQAKVNDGWELTDEYKNKKYAMQTTIIDSKTNLERKYIVWTKEGRQFIKKLFKNIVFE